MLKKFWQFDKLTEPFQNVRLEETENGNHLVIGQATPEAEGVRQQYHFEM